ncbi:beta-galactosidase [Streptomyces sp. NPDC007851]|uniref:beta-galactosidase n=1 Tax=Streptomyces sp. NPDC007851 TaxID=3155008 RepID=UPI0033E18321
MTTPNSHAFQGVYAFSGGNTSDLATNPDVAGRSLVFYWAQLEPAQGQYRWDLVDQAMQPWVAAGKKVILRVSAAGWAKWDTAADSAHGTPAWVYEQGVKSVTEQDDAVMPEYWNPAFEKDMATFLQAFAARYDGNANVAAVDISIGVGGESKADSEKNDNLLSLWQSIGYTDELWWQYAQETITAYTDVFHRTPLALMPDKTFIGTTDGYNEEKIVDYAVAKGIWLQDNGVVPGRTLSAPWGQTPVIAEMRGATSETGDNLADDLKAALAEHPVFVLVFTSDITDANRDVLHRVAAQVGTGG